MLYATMAPEAIKIHIAPQQSAHSCCTKTTGKQDNQTEKPMSEA